MEEPEEVNAVQRESRRNLEKTSYSKKKPSHSFYISEEVRYESFIKLKWPIPKVKAPEELAKAGFFYTGNKDIVQCFFCGDALCNWKINDDPFYEHVMKLPECGFVLQEKGEEYVEEARRKLRNTYAKEESRLSTFSCWPVSAEKTPKELAKAGFFYTGYLDEVRCFECGVYRMKWHVSDEPWYWHAKMNTSCRFVFNTKGQTFIDKVERVLLYVTNKFIKEPNRPIFKDYKNVKSRIASFKNWSHHNVKTPKELAAVGFFYTDEDDFVQCFNCGGQHFSWLKEENPWYEHARWYPDCQYLCQIKGAQFIEEVKRNIRNIYATEELRKMSFKDWPSTARKMPDELVEAGFFCTNNVDQVQCFECAAWKVGWEVYDDPWFEHAKLNPNCQFVNQVKGKIFVNTVEKAQKTFQKKERPVDTCRSLINFPIVQAFLNLGFKKSSIEEILLDHLTHRKSLNLDELSYILSNFLENTTEIPEFFKELKKSTNEFGKAKICKLCTNRGSTTIFAPCGHLHYCCPCHTNLGKCSVCQRKVLEKLHLF